MELSAYWKYYAARYSNITPLYRDGTKKLYVDGKATSRTNLVDLLENRVHGKYIAWLDSDDYWTDSLTPQKQADILDRNRNFSLCAHRVVESIAGGNGHVFPN